MATDPIDNAILALVTHLTSNVTVTYNGVPAALRAQQGWAENNQDVDLRTPFVTVTAFSEDRAEHSPYVLLDPDAPVGPPFKWHVADLRLGAQLDLFCPYRHTRAEVGELVRQALHDDIPYRPGLHLTSADYHNSQITIHAGRGRDTQMSAQAQVGEWRRTWDLTITCSEIIEANTAAQATWLLRTAVGDTLVTEDTNLP